MSNSSETNPKVIAKAAKEKGTKAFTEKKFKEAIKHFTDAISWDAVRQKKYAQHNLVNISLKRRKIARCGAIDLHAIFS